MGYTRTTWAAGDIISAAKLNNIESHLENLADAIVGARRTGSDQSLTQSVDSKLIWNTEDYDPDSLYDATTGRFTAGVTGVYLFDVSVESTSGSFNESNAQVLKAYKNGAALCTLSNLYRFRATQTLTGALLVKLTASDYIEFYLNNGNSSPVMDDVDSSYIAVARIS